MKENFAVSNMRSFIIFVAIVAFGIEDQILKAQKTNFQESSFYFYMKVRAYRCSKMQIGSPSPVLLKVV